MIPPCFLGVYRYEKESGRADAPNTSCLSPYLHFGQLSPRWLLWDAKGARCRPPKFQRKLAWRDLAYWQLTLFPDLPWESLRPPYKVYDWLKTPILKCSASNTHKSKKKCKVEQLFMFSKD